MTPHNISLSDAKLHLAKLAVPFSKLENDAWLEIRALREGKNGTSSLSQRFSPKNPSSVEHVLEFAARQNHQGYNIYITINPLNPVGSPFSPAKDDQVSAANYSNIVNFRNNKLWASTLLSSSIMSFIADCEKL